MVERNNTDFWNNTLLVDESNTGLLEHQNRGHDWYKPNTAFQVEDFIPTTKYGGGSVMSFKSFKAERIHHEL